MRRDKNYGPGLATRGREDIATAKQPVSGSPRPILRQKGVAGQQPRTAVTMRLTLLPPSGHRTGGGRLGRCPVCGQPHLSRSRALDDVTRARRLPCKHWVQPVIARSLSPYPETGAA